MADFMRCILGLLPYALEGTKGMERLFLGLQKSLIGSALPRERVMKMIEAMAKDTKPPAPEEEAYRRTFLDTWTRRGVEEGLIGEQDVSFAKTWLSSNAPVLQNAVDFVENIETYSDLLVGTEDETDPAPADTLPLSQDEESVLSGFMANSTPYDLWPSTQRRDSQELMLPPRRPNDATPAPSPRKAEGAHSSATGKRPALSNVTNLSKIKNKKAT